MHRIQHDGTPGRPRKPRRCRHFHGDRVFKPRALPMDSLSVVSLALDELEAVRLCDVEGLSQADAGERMGVSRGTVQRLVSAGREKMARAIVESRALIIGNGVES